MLLKEYLKIFLLLACVQCISIACETTDTSQQTKAAANSAQKIINRSILAHGTALFEKAKITFEFRDKTYTLDREKAAFTYARSFEDSLGWTEDVLTNSAIFTRSIKGIPTEVALETAAKYSRSINSVLYFFQVPYVLNDPAAQKIDEGIITLNGQNYHQIKITFSPKDGGKDFKDEFLYWIHTQTFEIDYFAYNYDTDGGGVRFREAINKRNLQGLLLQDYINYEPISKDTPLKELPQLYDQGSLRELSRILNSNIEIIPKY